MKKRTICKQCAKEFEYKFSKKTIRQYCSQLCSSINRKIKKEIIFCEECKKQFYVLPCRINKAKYCSLKCANPGRIKTKGYIPKGRAIFVTKKCESCSKYFEHNISRGNVARFCSVECTKRKPGNANCIQCKKQYEYAPRNRHGSIKFCSKKCAHLFNSENSFWNTASENDAQIYLKKIFKEKVKKHTNGCWEWLGGKYGSGYGAVRFKGKSEKIHRISYMFHNNDWNLSQIELICHHCDQKWCCAPIHLFKGSVKDNVQDMIRKNRQVWLRGENAPGAKMSENTAKKVVELLNKKIKMTEIAKQLNIGKGSVNSIKRGKAWRHLPRN